MDRERLYYDDPYLTTFTARVVQGSEPTRIRLDRTAFYPQSGGQPSDRGTISSIPVADVIEDETGSVTHILESPLPDEPGAPVECIIDSQRRFDHMQQHTGQHLLSAVLAEMMNAPTISFHMSAQVSTIDLAVPALDTELLQSVELRCNRIIAENRKIEISYEDAATVRDLRKLSEREGTLRIVTIDDLDRSACGGTHVRSTGEIGCVLLRATERIRGNVRLEFVCGQRAIRRARADYDALTAIARSLSAGISEAPELVAALVARLSDAEKQRTKLSVDLASAKGREAWRVTEPDANDLRIRVTEVPSIGDEARAEAQAFTAGGRAVALVWCVQPGSVLLSCSPDSGLHAGNVLKTALSACGGRGGGSAHMAQGGTSSDIWELVNALRDELNRTAAPR